MPIPTPKDGDAQRSGDLPPARGPASPQAKEPTWTPVAGRPGYLRDEHGRLKYDPFDDPQHPLYRGG